MQKIKISTPKGNIAATVHHPKEKNSKLAILCPGFLDSKDYLGLAILAEDLRVEGFVVVRFDPIGVWESDGDMKDYTMTQYLADIKSVLDYMLTEEKFEKILIGGHSRGGQMAVLYAARDARISAVLAIMPSHGRIVGERRNKWERNGEWLEKRDLPFDGDTSVEFHVPFNHVLDRDRYNALADVAKIVVPIAFFSGELDDTVEPEIVQELFENANEPKSFFIIPGIDHNYRLKKEEVELVNKEILKGLGTLGII